MTLMTTFWQIAGPELARRHGDDVVDGFLERTPALAMALIKRYTIKKREIDMKSEYACVCGKKYASRGVSVMISTCGHCNRKVNETMELDTTHHWALKPFW